MGRKPTSFIRIEFLNTRATCIIFIGRQLWYDAGKPDRLRVRRDWYGTTPELCGLIHAIDPYGWKVHAPIYRMPRLRIARDRAFGLGLVTGTYTGSIGANGAIEFSLAHREER